MDQNLASPCKMATPVDICCSYMCIVTQHQCTATLLLAQCIPHCSVLLCQRDSQHALCPCNCTCGHLLFMQVNLHRFTCFDKSLLSACFAQQHRAMGMHFAQTTAAVHWCWVTSHLYEQQIYIGLFALANACCQPALQSSTEQLRCFLTKSVLQCTGVGSLHSCLHSRSSIDVTAVTHCLL